MGATATLASWNDAEHATATFTAGTVPSIGSRTNQGSFENPAVTWLNFTAYSWVPGSKHAAWIQFTNTGDTPAVVSLASVHVDGTDDGVAPTEAGVLLRDALRLSTSITTVATTPGNAEQAAPGCNIDSVGSHTVVGIGDIPTSEGMPASAVLAPNKANVATFCLVLELPDDAPAGAADTQVRPQWKFDATQWRG